MGDHPPSFRSILPASLKLQQEETSGDLFAVPGIETFLAKTLEATSTRSFWPLYVGVAITILVPVGLRALRGFLLRKLSRDGEAQCLEALKIAPALRRDMPHLLSSVAQFGTPTASKLEEDPRLRLKFQYYLTHLRVALALVRLLSLVALFQALKPEQPTPFESPKETSKLLWHILRLTWIALAVKPSESGDREPFFTPDEFADQLSENGTRFSDRLRAKITADFPLLPTEKLFRRLHSLTYFQGIEAARNTYRDLREAYDAMRAAYDRLPDDPQNPGRKRSMAPPLEEEVSDRLKYASIDRWAEELIFLRNFYERAGTSA